MAVAALANPVGGGRRVLLGDAGCGRPIKCGGTVPDRGKAAKARGGGALLLPRRPLPLSSGSSSIRPEPSSAWRECISLSRTSREELHL